jgi:hypothetical protein
MLSDAEPHLVMKQAARLSLPRLWRFSPVSTITAYTTATEVVLSAMPPISAVCRCHPRTSLHVPGGAHDPLDLDDATA